MKIELSTKFWEADEETFKYKISNLLFFIGGITLTTTLYTIYTKQTLLWIINAIPTTLTLLSIITYPKYTRSKNEKRNETTN